MHPPVGCHSRRRWLAMLAAVAVLAAGTLPAVPAGAQELVLPEVTQWSSVADQTPFKRAFARCPDGSIVLGGGGRIFVTRGTDHEEIALRVSAPPAAMDGWAVTAQAMHPRAGGTDAPTWFVTAYAICVGVNGADDQPR